MTIFITGAGRGIGLEFVRQCLGLGHKVIATVRDPGKSPQIVELKERHAEALTVLTMDVSDAASCERVIAGLSAPVIDVLINNAGVLLDQSMSLETISKEALIRSFEVNAVAPMFVTRALLGPLQSAARPVVANITSLMGSMTDNESGGYYAYRMSKAALNMFCKSFSRDFPDVKILALHPGWVKTDMGGAQAPTSPEDSVRGLLQVIFNADKIPSGSFHDFRGKELEW